MRRRILALSILAVFAIGGGGSALAAALFCPHTACRAQTEAATQSHDHVVARAESTDADHCAASRPAAEPADEHHADDGGARPIAGFSMSDSRGGDLRCAHCFSNAPRPNRARAEFSADSVKRAADVEAPPAASEVTSVLPRSGHVAATLAIRGDPPGNCARRERHLLLGVFRI